MISRQVVRSATTRTGLGLGLGLGLRSTAVPLAMASNLTFRRTASTERITSKQAYDVLVEQRRNRPLSPDLEIYQPQLTSILSGLHRITGVAITGVLYAGLVGYVALPWVGLPVSVADVAGFVAGVPVAVKILAKLLLSTPLVYHSYNGLRHLLWDTGRALTLKGVYQTGYTVIGLTAVTTLGLALL